MQEQLPARLQRHATQMIERKLAKITDHRPTPR